MKIMNNYDEQTKKLLEEIIISGDKRIDRTGVGTRAIFGAMVHIDLDEGFPLTTLKEVSFKNIATELLWFLKGDTTIRYLIANSNNIWNEWSFKKWVESAEYNGPDMTDFGLRVLTDEAFKKIYLEEMKKFKKRILEDDVFNETYGNLGNVYGKQWRKWETKNGNIIDQIKYVIHEIKNNPTSRRIMVNAWNVGEIIEPDKNENYMTCPNPHLKESEFLALPPCHYGFQLHVRSNRKLDLMYNMRSNDVGIGYFYNVASYALLLMLIAKECGLEAGKLIYSGGDVHIYENHLEAVQMMLERESKKLPTLEIKEGVSIFDITFEDLKLIDYEAHPFIKMPIAV